MLNGVVGANLEDFLHSASLSKAKDKLVLLNPVDFLKLDSPSATA